jgi:hypothetical protein
LGDHRLQTGREDDRASDQVGTIRANVDQMQNNAAEESETVSCRNKRHQCRWRFEACV